MKTLPVVLLPLLTVASGLLPDTGQRVKQRARLGPSTEFRSHRTVNVTLRDNDGNRLSSSSRDGSDEKGHHRSALTLVLNDVEGSHGDLIVDLTLNTQLIPNSYVERYHHEVSGGKIDRVYGGKITRVAFVRRFYDRRVIMQSYRSILWRKK